MGATQEKNETLFATSTGQHYNTCTRPLFDLLMHTHMAVAAQLKDTATAQRDTGGPS